MRVKMCSYCVKGLGKSLGKAAATRDSSYNTSTSLSSISESSDESSSSILSTNIGSIIIDHPEIFPLLNEKKKEINVETPEDEDLVKTNFLKINFKKMCHLNVLF